MAHANARLTVHGRRLIIERARAGWKQAHIAAAMGVSRRCVKRWIERYRAEGEAGAGRPFLASVHQPDAYESRARGGSARAAPEGAHRA